MKSPLRFGTALTTIAVAAALSGCAIGRHHTASASSAANGIPQGDAALATRAMIALSSNDLVTAISLAERAIDKNPREAAIRTLLGNAYLASGRYASAAAAYRDSLYLDAGQADVLLKLSLVESALGRRDEATRLLQSGQDQLDAADLGLALALAGQPEQAIAVLTPAARAVGGDARVRQNLALAHALAGNWSMARTIAAQDVPGDQLDARLQQWMAMASPAQQANQVASFIGVAPAAIDPGQPTRLALVEPLTGTRQAMTAPAPAPAFSTASADVAAPAAAAMTPPPVELAAVEPNAIEPGAVEPAYVAPNREPVYYSAPSHPRVAAPRRSVRTASSRPRPDQSTAIRASLHTARPGLTLAAARLAPRLTMGNHIRTVVQLGAYSSQQRIGSAWNKVAAHNVSLRRYAPVSARYAATNGVFYRLSVNGFRSAGEATSLCSALKRSGTNCFVRTVAGDAPVNIATML